MIAKILPTSWHQEVANIRHVFMNILLNNYRLISSQWQATFFKINDHFQDYFQCTFYKITLYLKLRKTYWNDKETQWQHHEHESIWETGEIFAKLTTFQKLQGIWGWKDENLWIRRLQVDLITTVLMVSETMKQELLITSD